MGITSQNGEAESLLGKKSHQEDWRKNLIKGPFGIILLITLLLGAFYFLCNSFLGNNIPPESINNKKSLQAPNLLHITSIATTNGDYLRLCAPQVQCDPNARYRSINGSCNNLVTPTWGAAETPFHRMLDAEFSDGFYALRLQTNGSKLPSPRLVDVRVFLSNENYHVDENNVLLMPFGQLIAHDISGLPTDAPENELKEVTDCCGDENARKTFSQCQVVAENPPDDPVYSKHNISCMGLLRSLTSRNYSCPLYPTTFMNANTHFIDASEVYGSNEDVAKRLRMMEGGRLNFSTNDNGEMFCPFLKKKLLEPIELKRSNNRYDTGDPDNGNQNAGITAMQTLFLRFHNYIAFRLSAVNPHWSDEILYQESRRIIVGTIQHIAYNDFLPIIIGEDFQELYGLNKENIYDPTVVPSTSQEFSSAAYRVLHTNIPVQFNFMNREYQIESSMIITDWLIKPDLLPIGDNFDKLLKGFLETPGRLAQPSYNFFASNYMFPYPNKPAYTGLDLMAIDITRGRDVGLQPYNKVRQLCGLPMANDFDDLTDLIRVKDIKKLKELYHSVDDIDLMVGLLLEKLTDGAIVGHTARCLIADGFYRFKAGDRFFYDVQGQPGSFTPGQLKTIKKITLGHVICAVSNVDHVQQAIFKTVDHNVFPTSKMKCDGEFHIDLDAWEEPNDRPEL